MSGLVGHTGAREMDYSNLVDPSDIAAEVSYILSERDEIPINQAMVDFMRSDTFKRLLHDSEMLRMEPKMILELFDEERGQS